MGLGVGLRFGGRACLQHLGLRLFLVRCGWAPWPYVKFLNYAADILFLRRVGGGYIFIHRLLQDHFAALYKALQALTPENLRLARTTS
jgi:eukaryotic-like serine/threonine-protein kinase